MKKIIILLVVLALAACKPMDRKNPTDIGGTNYCGWTYIGEAGNFYALSDLIIAPDAADGKDHIFAVDSVKEKIFIFLTDGTAEGSISNPPVPVFFNPTGICELNGYCYVMDPVSIDAFQTAVLSNAWTDVTVNGDKILSYGTMLYVVNSDPPAVQPYTSDTTFKTYSGAGLWPVITKGDTTCANCMDYISGIAVHPEVNPAMSEILLVDSGLKRIAVFSLTGTFLKTIDVGSDISDVAVYNDTLYVPTTDGIRRYNYNTGALIDTIANYGEGNGRVMKPGPIKLYTDPSDGKHYIYAGAGTFIKVFEISGF